MDGRRTKSADNDIDKLMEFVLKELYRSGAI
jgi:hypothetical protein